MQRTFKTRGLQKILAASAVLLAIGGTAHAQTPAPAPQTAAPGQTGKAGPMGGPMAEHHGRGEHGGMWMRMMDTDGDGTISKAEADAWFNRIDANHDGKLDRNEMAAFHKTMREQFRAQRQQEFDAKFKEADKNGDGALTKQEAQAGMPGLARHFDQLDTNHDGKLTRDEIRAGMEKMHQERMQRMERGGQPPSSSGG